MRGEGRDRVRGGCKGAVPRRTVVWDFVPDSRARNWRLNAFWYMIEPFSCMTQPGEEASIPSSGKSGNRAEGAFFRFERGLAKREIF